MDLVRFSGLHPPDSLKICESRPYWAWYMLQSIIAAVQAEQKMPKQDDHRSEQHWVMHGGCKLLMLVNRQEGLPE